MYLLPAVNLQLRPRLLALAPGTRVVSHDWDMGDWLPDRTVTVDVPDKAVGRRRCRASTCGSCPRARARPWCARGARLEIAQRFQHFSATLTGAAPPRRPLVFDGRIEALDAAFARRTADRAEDRGRRAAHATRRHRDRAGLAGRGAVPACDLEELPMKVLRRGMSGAAVSGLQQALLDKGFDPGLVDGAFGGGTEAAVLAFQKSEGLLADGIAGPRTLNALRLVTSPALPDVTGAVTVEMVSQMFPFTAIGNIKAQLPFVLAALKERGLHDRPMVLMALATIRAEAEPFLPVDEGRSKFNTSPNGHPFDLYDNRRDLGNRGRPDGDRFKGRGFVQLTGRDNYRRYGPGWTSRPII